MCSPGPVCTSRINEDDYRHGAGEHPERDVGEPHAHQRHARLVLHQPIDGAHEPVQHPHDHGVDMHHAVDVEVEDAVQEIRIQELQTRRAGRSNHLREEQHHRHGEVLERQALRGR